MNIENMERLLLRISEAAEALGIGKSTLYELIQAGEIPVVRVGRATRVPAAELRVWAEAHTVSAQAEA